MQKNKKLSSSSQQGKAVDNFKPKLRPVVQSMPKRPITIPFREEVDSDSDVSDEDVEMKVQS